MIVRDVDPAYESFFSNDVHSLAAEVDISLEVDQMPDLKTFRKIFDGTRSWSLFLEGDEYFMVLNPEAFGKEPVWIARFRPHDSTATVYCNRVLMDQGDGSPTILNPVRYPLDQILLMYLLAGRQGKLIHAAAADASGRGYVFLGRSGAGKSTISRQFVGRRDVELLSDDRIVVRKLDNAYRVFGTPWPGEAGIALNKSSPLAYLFFLRHGTENKIREMSRKEAFEALLPVTSIPWYDRGIVDLVLFSCEDLIAHVPAYELYFKPDVGVVDLLLDGFSHG